MHWFGKGSFPCARRFMRPNFRVSCTQKKKMGKKTTSKKGKTKQSKNIASASDSILVFIRFWANLPCTLVQTTIYPNNNNKIEAQTETNSEECTQILYIFPCDTLSTSVHSSCNRCRDIVAVLPLLQEIHSIRFVFFLGEINTKFVQIHYFSKPFCS